MHISRAAMPANEMTAAITTFVRSRGRRQVLPAAQPSSAQRSRAVPEVETRVQFPCASTV